MTPISHIRIMRGRVRGSAACLSVTVIKAAAARLRSVGLDRAGSGAGKLQQYTGPHEISLLSLSTSGLPLLRGRLVKRMHEVFTPLGVKQFAAEVCAQSNHSCARCRN